MLAITPLPKSRTVLEAPLADEAGSLSTAIPITPPLAVDGTVTEAVVPVPVFVVALVNAAATLV